VFYFNTFAAAPIAAAAANAVLDEIQDRQLMQNASAIGDYVRDGFAALAERHSLIGDIREDGLWVGIELVRDRQRKTAATEETGRLVNLLKDAGVLVSRIGPFDNVLKIRPPLVFGRENADELLHAASICLARL